MSSGNVEKRRAVLPSPCSSQQKAASPLSEISNISEDEPYDPEHPEMPPHEKFSCSFTGCADAYNFESNLQIHQAENCPYGKINMCALLKLGMPQCINVEFASVQAQEALEHLDKRHQIFRNVDGLKGWQKAFEFGPNTRGVVWWRASERLMLIAIGMDSGGRRRKLVPYVLGTREESLKLRLKLSYAWEALPQNPIQIDAGRMEMKAQMLMKRIQVMSLYEYASMGHQKQQHDFDTRGIDIGEFYKTRGTAYMILEHGQ